MSMEKYVSHIAERIHSARLAGFRSYSLAESYDSEHRAHKKWFKGEFGSSIHGSIDSAGRGGRSPMGGPSSHTPDEVHKKLTSAGFKKGRPINDATGRTVVGHTYTKPSKSGQNVHLVRVTHDQTGKKVTKVQPDTVPSSMYRN